MKSALAGALCVNDCPNAHLYLENKKVKAAEGGCIERGHCFAVCPMNAVKMAGYDCADEPVAPMTAFDSSKL